jgi:nucleotide-binding universal stress UspA family protein
MSYATLLVHLECGRSNERLLQVAGALAQQMNARVVGVAACRPLQVNYGDGFVTGDLLESDRREIDLEFKEARREFDDALESHGAQLVWRPAVVYGALSDHLAGEARCADLIVTGAGGSAIFNATRRADLGELVLQAGRPVLVVPPTAGPLLLDRALIAWKDSREARRAALDALPLLQKASAVAVAEVAPEAELPAARERVAEVSRWLDGHGVKAEAMAVPRRGEDAARIEGLAREWRADVLVAGAYGHSRLREWVLGGVTRDLLLSPTRCVLVSH